VPSHFAFLAGSVDIELPDGAGYAILTAVVVALVVSGVLMICILLRKKSDPMDSVVRLSSSRRNN
jgi:hypothetical protein